MPQTIALQTEVAKINLPRSIRQAEKEELGLESMRMSNEAEGLDLYEKGQKAGAVDQFRKRSMAGDPEADEALAGYPDMRKQAIDTFDGLDAKGYRETRKRVKAFGEAAKYVSSFPDGPEKQAAWEEKIDELADAGYIEPQDAERYKAGGPNDLMLHNAMSVEDWMKSHFKEMDSERKAEIERYKADKKSETDLGKASLKVEEAKIKAAEDDETDEAKIADTESKIADRKHRQVMAEKRAERDAENVKSQIKARDAKASKDGGKTDRDDTKTRIDVEKLIIEHAKALNLDDPKFKEDYPEDHAEALRVQNAYATRMLKEFGFDAQGKRKAAAPGGKAQGGPPPLADRVVGQVYDSPNGKLEWTGKGWKKAE